MYVPRTSPQAVQVIAFDFKVSTLNRKIWSFNHVPKASSIAEFEVDDVISQIVLRLTINLMIEYQEKLNLCGKSRSEFYYHPDKYGN
jgi:hypothetical protein